ncbi:TPA: MbeB family mobilization protein [Klebsiella pneumoniae]
MSNLLQTGAEFEKKLKEGSDAQWNENSR